jgi:hypothetical protein
LIEPDPVATASGSDIASRMVYYFLSDADIDGRLT